MIKYQRNNIIFRITSSDAISKFKSRQAQSFVQLARKELNFNDSAREAVLLEYDRLSQWIFRAERICLAAQEGEMPESLVRAFQESLKEEILVIEGIVDSHPEVFCPIISSFLKLVHSYALGIAYARMDNRMHQHIDRAFGALVEILSDYLEHVLICYHELNNNCLQKNNVPFVGLTNYVLRCDDNEHLFDPLIRRCDFYKKQGCGDTYIGKNYSEFEDVFAIAKNFVSKQGISLIEEIHTEAIQAQPDTVAAAYA